jgi:hypothetical protein
MHQAAKVEANDDIIGNGTSSLSQSILIFSFTPAYFFSSLSPSHLSLDQ